MFNFNVSSAESNLFYNVADESIKLFGVPLKYIKAENQEKDSILGEFKQQNYTAANVYNIYGKFESVDGFAEPLDLYSKFGIQVQDSMEIFVSDKTFTDLGFTPLPNDIIYWIDGRAALEVTKANREMSNSGFYLGGRPAIYWKVSTRKYIFDNDTFSTGTNLDNIMSNVTSADRISIADINTSINNILDSDESSPWE